MCTEWRRNSWARLAKVALSCSRVECSSVPKSGGPSWFNECGLPLRTMSRASDHLSTSVWMDAAGFARSLDDLLAQAAWSSGPEADLHGHPAWFQLLAMTALEPGTRLACWPAGGQSVLPIMSSPGDPCRATALATFYSPLYLPMGAGRPDAQVIYQSAREARHRPWRLCEVRWGPMDPDGPAFEAIQTGFRRAGWWVGRYFCFGNWYQKVTPGDYAAYFSQRPSQTRNTVNRSAKKLAKMSGYRLVILTVADDALEQGILDFIEVYNKSWKRPEPFPEFIPELCRRAAKAGLLRLGLIHVEGQPVAAQLWLVHRCKAHIVKLAYDQAFDKASAGSVLTAALMSHVIDTDLVTEVDYLIGDDPYKRHWMDQRRERWGLVAFNPMSVSGFSRAARHAVGRVVSRLREAWRRRVAAPVEP